MIYSKAIRLLSPASVLRHWLFHCVMSICNYYRSLTTCLSLFGFLTTLSSPKGFSYSFTLTVSFAISSFSYSRIYHFIQSYCTYILSACPKVSVPILVFQVAWSSILCPSMISSSLSGRVFLYEAPAWQWFFCFVQLYILYLPLCSTIHQS